MLEEAPPVASTSAVQDGDVRQIAIRLSTKDKAFEIPSTKFLVPANWRRFHLSELINKVLDNCQYPSPSPRSIVSPTRRAIFFSQKSQNSLESLPKSWKWSVTTGEWEMMIKLDMRKVFFVLSFRGNLRRCRQPLHFLIPFPALPYSQPSTAIFEHCTDFFPFSDDDDTASPIPFDFLINAALLRSSLGAYCAASGTSEEVTLEIEYLPSTLPPQLESTLPAEDWVSDVSLGLRGCVVSPLSTCPAISNAHFFILRFVFFLVELFSLPRTLERHRFIRRIGPHRRISRSADMIFPSFPVATFRIRLASRGRTGSRAVEWIVSVVYSNTKSVSYTLRPRRKTDIRKSQTPSLDPSAALSVPKTLYTLPLHTGPIASVRSHALPLRPTATPSPHLITAGWDGLIGIWDLTNGVNEGEPGLEDGERKRKRRKPGVVITKVSPFVPSVVGVY